MNASIEEFDIIERYFAGKIKFTHENILLGPGDDCAIFTVPGTQAMCISTDTLIEGTHFPENCAADIVAHRSLVANLSDLAAMGAKPFAYTLALTLDKKSASHTWLETFSRTLDLLGNEYAIPLIGGNLASGNLSLTFTVMGTVNESEGIKRSGALAGDDIYVTGYLGDAAGGLKIIQAGDQQERFTDPKAQLVTRFNYPTPRIAIGQALNHVAHAAVDISDGFAADLSHICKSSGVAAEVELELIPVSDSLTASFGLDEAQLLAIGGGDDYELCFTAAPEEANVVKQISRDTGVPITRVGSVVGSAHAEVDVVVRNQRGEDVSIGIKGYRHF